jgi:hypothetical protein
MTGLFLFSELVARLVDRRRGKNRLNTEQWDDNAASPL